MTSPLSWLGGHYAEESEDQSEDEGGEEDDRPQDEAQERCEEEEVAFDLFDANPRRRKSKTASRFLCGAKRR
jgi:hypothetical protein